MTRNNALTAADAVASVRTRLATHDCPNTDAAREAEALICHVAGITREALAAHPEKPLDDVAVEQLDALVARRLTHEPLAYLLGTAPFLGRDFEVTPATLIPRPATETLVAAAIAYAKTNAAAWIDHDETGPHAAWTSPREAAQGGSARRAPTLASRNPPGLPHVGVPVCCIDVGTGSGCIAITLAAELPYPVVATDLSEAALVVARRNAMRNGVADRIAFVHADGLGATAAQNLLIVANLPYIPSAHIPILTKEVLREPASALDGGMDGLDAYRALFAQLDGLSEARTIALFVEILPEQEAAFRALAEQHSFSKIVEIKNDADTVIGVRCVRGG